MSYIWQRHVLVYLSSTADKHKHNSFFPKTVFAKTSALSCQVNLLSAQTKTQPFTFQSSIPEQKHVDRIKLSLVFNLKLLYYLLLSTWKRLDSFWCTDSQCSSFLWYLAKDVLRFTRQVRCYILLLSWELLENIYVCAGTLVLINVIMNTRLNWINRKIT